MRWSPPRCSSPVGPERLAGTDAPLAAAARAGSLDWLARAVRIGGALASLAVLVSLIAGVTRTTLAMARERELPGALDAVHPRFRVPHRVELAIGAVVVAIVLAADVRGAIGFGSFTVLTYYAIANACAWTLSDRERRWPRWLAAAGVAGCLALAVTLPPASAAAGAGVLAAGAAGRALIRRRPER